MCLSPENPQENDDPGNSDPIVREVFLRLLYELEQYLEDQWNHIHARFLRVPPETLLPFIVFEDLMALIQQVGAMIRRIREHIPLE